MMRSQKIGIVRFPGTNCDRDIFSFVEAKSHQAQYLWHLDQFNIREFDALILPGGFSYGDYLRSGALSSRAPIMKSVKEFADFGKPILGICNGFQILTEAGLLPGALVKNSSLRFIDDWVRLKMENRNEFWAKDAPSELSLPIAHGDGRFYAPEGDLQKIEDSGQVWLRYEETPNGSLHDIAGVMNVGKNVVGLMPHPERALYEWMGGVDGWGFL
jgi:phosphoribosylformylglycinamidine synthase